ncbi:hypothetical protein [Pseudorhodoferax sp. Leaf267]|uniref:hypothetical protein n=1 Tax=Pseudorhodoferax sp. Leaf267 TaxID=1736316 RepID=UPI0006F37072|nr:hypothetical protein [Pseudorhodoferax sp. Leaf267]KQP22361.1 hypothetical protein ASF43_00025 [Pseudorhodoferax sp. Leaf267]
MRHIVASIAIAAGALAASAGAQQTVYLCDGTYTDKPCKGGKEVDIAPTRGAHSMSGKRRESTEAVVERIRENNQAAYQKGMKQAQDNMRCDQLRRRREVIDRSKATEALDGERLHIREEQFALKCRRQ